MGRNDHHDTAMKHRKGNRSTAIRRRKSRTSRRYFDHVRDCEIGRPNSTSNRNFRYESRSRVDHYDRNQSRYRRTSLGRNSRFDPGRNDGHHRNELRYRRSARSRNFRFGARGSNDRGHRNETSNRGSDMSRNSRDRSNRNDRSELRTRECSSNENRRSSAVESEIQNFLRRGDRDGAVEINRTYSRRGRNTQERRESSSCEVPNSNCESEESFVGNEPSSTANEGREENHLEAGEHALTSNSSIAPRVGPYLGPILRFGPPIGFRLIRPPIHPLMPYGPHGFFPFYQPHPIFRPRLLQIRRPHPGVIRRQVRKYQQKNHRII